MKKIFIKKNNKQFLVFAKSVFWFFMGIFLGLFFCASFAFIVFQKQYANVIYPGVMVNGIDFGTKTQEEVRKFFAQKNEKIAETKLVFSYDSDIATISAGQIDFGYNEELLAKQAFSIGRSDNFFSNVSLVFQAYLNEVNLAPSYRYLEEQLETFLSPISEKIKIEPVDALFTFQNNKVIAFRLSSNGQQVDMENLKNQIYAKLPFVVEGAKPQILSFSIPVKVIKPKVTTDQVNSLGIKELIANGTSLFAHSIPNRIFNVTLAASRMNGILVEPGEVFSFDKALGDVSAFTGYQQAYVIQNGKTVLGDGGGVCQVSTTFFRALLNAGLPIVERHAHAYRVGYYEQDSPPGFDATIYVPSVDLKFKNDTGHHILIQTSIDPEIQQLTFSLYGTKDQREVTISKPVVSSQTPAPEPLYQDDPTLPKGQTKQVDYAAAGASVYFTREIKKNGKTILSEKFVSNYKPWQAVFLRGTRE